MSNLFHHQQHPHTPLNVNQAHADTLSQNDRIATFVAQRVGTMWFCYGLALLMTGWALLQWALGHTAFDAFPFPFLFFCLGGIMQSLLMPLIMVAQNLSARHQEMQSDEQYQTTQKIYADAEQVVLHLNAQDEKILTMLRSLESQSVPIPDQDTVKVAKV